MRFATQLTNRLANIMFLPAHEEFIACTRKASETQNRKLMQLLKTNAETSFGIRHRFNSIHSIEQFQQQVPISVYEDYKDSIELISNGKTGILTKDKVLRFMISSGTSIASKWIPYTAALKKEFNACLQPWLFNLNSQFPKISNGKSFWIISPQTPSDYDKSVIPVGFDDDSKYFGNVARFLIRNSLATPDWIAAINNIENYYYLLSYYLLKTADLALISVWNPSIIPIILQKAILYKDQICADLKNGKLNLPFPIQPTFKNKLPCFRNEKRSRIIQDMLHNSTETPWLQVWQGLQLISCWADAWALLYIPEINSLFPQIPIQPKGLLATEAVISFPMYQKNELRHVLAVNSHFFEFIDPLTSTVHTINNLESGKEYEVVVSTAGGLYRYRLFDLIQITGFYNEVPTIKFVGKTNLLCDITGEKLNELFVKKCFEGLFLFYQKPVGFCFLAPALENGKAFYLLFIEKNNYLDSSQKWQAFVKELDIKLSGNYHYKHSRAIGQLGDIKIFVYADAIEINNYFLHIHKNKMNTRKHFCLEKELNLHLIISGTLIS